ncbi:hypothetical protein [Nodosilinea nodulosa]|uniref:hypothetical protein n=1 Tax=Nodosilinea nodulosa TaxID=416001 RepID=UPI0003699449|nr:hypothetical protein [Nodosilinea nodulosa]
MNPDFLKRTAIGSLIAGTDSGYDILMYGRDADPETQAQIKNTAILGGIGGLGGNFAGQGLSSVFGLTGSGKAGAVGDILSAGMGLGGSILGGLVGGKVTKKQAQDLESQLQLIPYQPEFDYAQIN